MALKEIVAVNTKRIYTATPSQVSSLRRDYLRSLSPVKVPRFLRSSAQPPQPMRNFNIKTLTFEPKDPTLRMRKFSMVTHTELTRPKTPPKSRSIQRKTMFKEKLRLNNL